MGKKKSSAPELTTQTTTTGGSQEGSFARDEEQQFRQEEDITQQRIQSELSRLIREQTEQQLGRTFAEPTALETQLQNLLFGNITGVNPQAQAGRAGFAPFVSNLQQGRALPGLFESLGQGIDPQTQQSIVNRSVEMVAPKLERLGIGSSGPAAQIYANIARDVGIQSALEGIRQRENLLGLLPTFQGLLEAPAAREQGLLASLLPGLRPTTAQQTGVQAGSTIGETLSLLSSLANALLQSQGKGTAKGTTTSGFTQTGTTSLFKPQPSTRFPLFPFF